MASLPERKTSSDELLRLSRKLDSMRTLLQSYRDSLHQNDVPFPADVSENLAAMAGQLLQLRELVQALEEERQSLHALAEIGYLVNSSLDLATVLNGVMDIIVRLSGAERVFLMLRDAHGEMDIVVARNWAKEALKPGEYEYSRSIVNAVVEQGEAVLTTNAQDDPRFGERASVVAFSLRSILCVPLKAKDELIGVIYVDNKAREGLFNERDLQLFTAFANQAAVALENAQLFNDLAIAYDQTLEALVTALEARDHETEGHTRRVVLYTMALARKLGLGDQELLDLRRGALIHDIGKLGVPDSILLKPGGLSKEEQALMQRHAVYGLRMLEGIKFLEGASGIIASHHEHYDGTGYPYGLDGEQIPLGARIFAVADAFDAMTSDRPYRRALSYAEAAEEITRGRGQQFDPQVVDAFLAVEETEWQALKAITIPRNQRGKLLKDAAQS
jgi:putative nucleotidyltransferase with HDIG domain